MLVVIDRIGRVVARVGTEERARKIQRMMAHNLGRSTLVHDERDPRGRAILDRQVRVVLGRQERLFGEPPEASEWAMSQLKQEMTVGAQARFYRGSSRSPYSVLKLTERGVVVTRGANVGSVV